MSVIQAALGNKSRFASMEAFFGPVGKGDTAGVWSEVPKARPEFRAKTKRQAERLLAQRKAEEMGS